jgi:hypothetical protein
LVWIQKWTKEGLPAGRLCQRSSWLRSWASLVGSRLGKSLCILNEEVICFGLYQHFKDLASLFKDLRKKPHKNRINTPKKKKNKQTNISSCGFSIEISSWPRVLEHKTQRHYCWWSSSIVCFRCWRWKMARGRIRIGVQVRSWCQ